MNKNFTYYFLEDNLINSIRFSYKGDSVILTIYFYYFSLYYKPILKKLKHKNFIIYNWYDEHEKELHKDDDPYEWHTHIQIDIKDLELFLKELLKKNNNFDLKNIINYLNNPSDKYKNIEYKGSKSNKHLQKHKDNIEREDNQYKIFKREIHEKTFLRLSFYLLRFNKFKFKLSSKLLSQLTKIDTLQNKNELKCILEMFEKINGQKIYVDIDLNIKKNKKTYTKDNKIIIHGKEEWQKRLIHELIIFCGFNIYDINYTIGRSTLNLNKSYTEFLSLILVSYYRYYNYNYDKNLTLEEYLTYRLNLELSWSMFQSSKILRNNNVKKYSNVTKTKLKNILLECYLAKSYFLFYTKFQNCINFENKDKCSIKVDLMNKKFKDSMDFIYSKVKIIVTEQNSKSGLMTTKKLSVFK